jgi:hypothetical protein
MVHRRTGVKPAAVNKSQKEKRGWKMEVRGWLVKIFAAKNAQKAQKGKTGI